MTVAEAARLIQQREGEGGPEFGLFQPKSSRNRPRWLKMDQKLEFYELRNDDTLEYKKRMRPLKVKLEDGMVKTMLIDDSHTVAQVVEAIGQKMQLKNWEEFTLKYDTKDQWLVPGATLAEQGVADRDAVVLKKRFFVNDANVDRSDPVQLHLVYAQSKNSIFAGDHPLTPTECANLIALECQIVHGDYRPAFGYNDYKEYLPPQYKNQKGVIEPLLVSEYKKLVGMTEINAKFRFVSDCRKLKTYGITTFKVGQKEEGKKKPVERFLGVTRDAIMILDGETRAIVREFPLTHLRRWAAAPKNFTLDFGDYEDDYFSLLTTEGETISQLIGGYIDILLKKRKDAARVIEDDGALTAHIGEVGGVSGLVTKGMTPGRGRTGKGGAGAGGDGVDAGHPLEYTQGPYGQQIKVTDLAQANRALMKMLDEASPFGDYSMLNASRRSPEEWRQQMMMEARNARLQSDELNKLFANAENLDAALLNACASKMGGHVGALLNAARLAAMAADGDPALLDSARLLAEAVAKMLKNANDLRNDPNNEDARLAYNSAREEFEATQCMLNASCSGKLADEADQRLLLAQAKIVAAAVAEMGRQAQESTKAMPDSANKKALATQAARTDATGGQLLAVSRTLAPTIIDDACQGALLNAGKQVKASNGQLLAASKAAGMGGAEYKGLLLQAKAVSDAIAELQKAAQRAEPRPRGDAQLAAATYRMAQAAQGLGEAAGKPKLIIERTKLLAQCQSRLMALTKARAQALPADERQALLDAAKALAAATQTLVDSAKTAARSPHDAQANAALRSQAADVEAKARQVGRIGNRGGQVQLLRANAKYAVAATAELQAAAVAPRAKTGDAQSDQNLLQAAKNSATAMQQLLAAVYACNGNDPNAFESLAQTARTCVGDAFPLVAGAKRAVPQIRDVGAKQNVQLTANEAQGAIKRLVDSTKVERAVGSDEFDDAFATLSDDANELEQASLSIQQGSLRAAPGTSKEQSLAQINSGARQLGQASMETAKAANNPAMLGSRSKAAAETSSTVVRAAKQLAANVDDRETQTALIEKAKAVNAASMDMLGAAQTVADDPGPRDHKVALAQAAKANAAAVADLVRTAKSTEANGVDAALMELARCQTQLDMQPAPNGADFKVPAQQLVQATQAVDAATQALARGAAERRRQAVDAAGRQLAQKLPLLVAAANAAAAAAPDAGTRSAITRHINNALQAEQKLLNDAKRGAPLQPQPVSDALQQAASACDVLTPDERKIADAIRDYNDAASRAIHGTHSATGTGNYAADTQALSARTKALLQAMSRLQAASKAGTKDMPDAFVQVASAATPFVDAAAAAQGSANAPDTASQLQSAAADIAQRGQAFLQQAQQVYNNPRAPQEAAALANEYRNTATAVRSLIGAIQKGATGAAATTGAVQAIERLLQELTSGVFDAHPPAGATFESELAQCGQNAPAVGEAARDFAALPIGDQQGMGRIAGEASAAALALGERAKCAVRLADADDKQTSTQLVNRARALLTATRETLRAGAAYQQNASNQRAAEAMRRAAAGAQQHAQAVKALADAAAAGPEVSVGERALDDAQQRLQELLQTFRSGGYAGAPAVPEFQEADEVCATARQCAAEAAGIAGSSDAALRDAAMSSVLAAEQLLQRTAAVLPTSTDAQGQQRLSTSSAAVVEALVTLCEAGKARARRSNAATQNGVNDAASVVAERVNAAVQAANETLPKKPAAIESGENLEELAESELEKCAREIAKAAAAIMAKGGRARSTGLEAFDAVADAILDSAQAIAAATQKLVIVATKAQKEISANSSGAGKESVYMKDPAWARGLISAAQAVAGNVKLLVTAANKAASNEGSEEELIACGRGVQAATIRLVTAARAKADPFSPTQRELQGAAKEVQQATEGLVQVAKQYSEVYNIKRFFPLSILI